MCELLGDLGTAVGLVCEGCSIFQLRVMCKEFEMEVQAYRGIAFASVRRVGFLQTQKAHLARHTFRLHLPLTAVRHINFSG